MGQFPKTTVKGLSRTAVVAFAAVALLIGGCSEPITTYQVGGPCISTGQKVLVLPFMDTRTFIDDNDPHQQDLGEHARDIFVASMREQSAGQPLEILTPALPKRDKSLTNAEVAELGRQYGADTVVAGQVFSYTDTRAASIPARAGMFVRVLSASDGTLLFVGDHYQAASIPGAGGGRDLQAKNVSNRLIEGIIAKSTPVAGAVAKVSSTQAFASLAVAPRRAVANNIRPSENRGGDLDFGPLPEPPPFIDFSGPGIPDPSDWDEQIAPAIPPAVDIHADFPEVAMVKNAEKSDSLPLPPPPPIESPTVDATNEPASKGNADSFSTPLPPSPPESTAPEKVTLAAVMPEPVPLPPPPLEELPAEVAAEIMATSYVEKQESSGAPVAEEAFAALEPSRESIVEAAVHSDTGLPAAREEKTVAAIESANEDEAYAALVEPELPDVPDVDGYATSAMPAAEDAPESYAEQAKVAEEDLQEPMQAAALAGNDDAALVEQAKIGTGHDKTIEATTASAIDNTSAEAEPSQATVAPVDSVAEVVVAKEEEWDVYAQYAAAYGETVQSITIPPAATAAPTEMETIVPESKIIDAATAAYLSGDELAADLFETNGSPAFLPEKPQAALIVPVAALPAVGSDTGTASLVQLNDLDYMLLDDEPDAMVDDLDNGPVISTPLVVEQPRPFKAIALVQLQDDPNASGPSLLPEVSALPRPAERLGGIRVLLLPYHDRDNPNNLITNTGGGEVVTTLYGTQLALDPGVQLLWDASGLASHDRLVDRDEAVQLGKLVGADYVVRGQVVEFRRAQSVPSFYSAVISTAVLAAQIFFAEMSGVDVATEVYRVSDGACVMSRRDRAQQKYVVQAEKTVRRLAAGMAESVGKVIRNPSTDLMDPLIDDLTPVTVLSNPR